MDMAHWTYRYSFYLLLGIYFITLCIAFFIYSCVNIYVFLERGRRIVKRRERLVEQFKDAIILLYSFISTGSTLEYAFLKASKSCF